MVEVEIGVGKSARRGYALSEVTIVPSRRTRDEDDVDTSWHLDAFRFDLPVMASAMDSVMSPKTAVAVGSLGALGVLDLEGVWTRHEDPESLLEELAGLPRDKAVPRLREIYSAPIRAELMVEVIKKIAISGTVTAGALSPKHVVELAPAAIAAGLEVLVIQSLVVSAEHVSRSVEALDLASFIRDLDIPVVVGGCSSYQAALHLMRTGAVGVLVGVGAGSASTNAEVLGVGAPHATAIADAAGARTRHLEETGSYVQVIADGGMASGGDIARAIACGADAVMIGAPLASSVEAPGRGWHFGARAGHATLARSARVPAPPRGTLEEIMIGPACSDDGRTNLAGGLRRAMATCGCATVKELQKAEVVVARPLEKA